jgi:hypothetical protein
MMVGSDVNKDLELKDFADKDKDPSLKDKDFHFVPKDKGKD